MYTCPVCGYNKMPSLPEDYTICPSCGTEFWVDDVENTTNELRAQWVNSGYAWHSRTVPKPQGWNPREQLGRILEPAAVQETTSTFSVHLEGATLVFFIDLGKPHVDARPVRAVSKSTAGADIGFAYA